MYFSDPTQIFTSHGIEFYLCHWTGRRSALGKTIYHLSHNNSSKFCNEVKLRSLKQLVKKYCGSDCVIISSVNKMYNMYELEIDSGTTKEQRATFLAALATKAQFLS